MRTGLVMYQWTSVDHVALERILRTARTASKRPRRLTSSTSTRSTSTGTAACLISARNTWTAYDLNAADRPDQLAARRQALELYDGARNPPPPGSTTRGSSTTARSASSTTAPPRRCTASRAASSSASNTQGKTATLLSQFTHPPPILTQSQGDMQALANGDWFVGWGEVPDFSEFSPTGQLLFDAHFPAGRSVLPGLALRLDGHPRAPAGVRRAGGPRHGRGQARGPCTRAGTARRSSRAGGCSWALHATVCSRSRRSRAAVLRRRSRCPRGRRPGRYVSRAGARRLGAGARSAPRRRWSPDFERPRLDRLALQRRPEGWQSG